MDDCIHFVPNRQGFRLATPADVAADRPPNLPIKRPRPVSLVWDWAYAAVRYGEVPAHLNMRQTAAFLRATLGEAEEAVVAFLPDEPGESPEGGHPHE